MSDHGDDRSRSALKAQKGQKAEGEARAPERRRGAVVLYVGEEGEEGEEQARSWARRGG